MQIAVKAFLGLKALEAWGYSHREQTRPPVLHVSAKKDNAVP